MIAKASPGRRTGLVWWWAATALVVAAIVLVARSVDPATFATTWRAASGEPAAIAAVLGVYGVAFVLRAWVWTRLVPALSFGIAWSAIHVSLGANHVLPLRLGEVFRVTTAVGRGRIPADVATASTLVLRSADIVAVAALAVLLGPRLVQDLLGGLAWLPVAAVTLVGAAGVVWLRRTAAGVPAPALALAAGGAVAGWVLESVVVWQAARWAGIELSAGDAVLVTAVTIAAQVFAVAPGGLGTYEVAATAALVALGAGADAGFAAALTAHALKTAYSLVTGAVALFVPGPGAFGRLRLADEAPPPPPPTAPDPAAPVVLFLPAHDEVESVGGVVARAPGTICGRHVETIVVDDGSSDGTAGAAAAAGATVVSMGRNRGLGAAVRRGLREGVARGAAAIAFCDADGEYAPEELERVVTPILEGSADYVVGSRFAGRIDRMLPHRRFGNVVLTKALSFVARRQISDGQSGYRALSLAAAADAEIVHDYNYAQVLTLDLLGKGYRYAEVPISYRFRTAGKTFVKLGRYLRNVVPAVHREINGGRSGVRGLSLRPRESGTPPSRDAISHG
ncbi:MAG TPA: lysylphosphatidylglycerol synthase domain-containing protein [Actinomycetota bacterium]|nr:lysylphosphatidylglycerol synthase domain-containing protein [Actinomycetota bacterium]